jgi:hypothetical protein
MEKSSRRSFLKSRTPMPGPFAAAGGTPDIAASDGTSRRVFLEGTAGAAAGTALILATPKVASIALDHPSSSSPVAPEAVAVTPSGPAPHEPVTAYVRNAERGEVTVMFGKRETTYRDPVLVKRLLDAAR